MERQNVTVSLPKALLKKAKIMAAKTDKSLSELIREAMEEKVKESTGYQRAQQRHLMLLRTGIYLGTKGSPAISRDELHARR